MLRLFPSRIELAPKDILEATERHESRQRARKDQRVGAIQSARCLHGRTSLVPVTGLSNDQILASYPSQWPHSLQDPADVTLPHLHRVENKSDLPDQMIIAPPTALASTTAEDTARYNRDSEDGEVDFTDDLSTSNHPIPSIRSYAEQLFQKSTLNTAVKDQSGRTAKVSTSRKLSAFSKFFDGFNDDSSLLEGFSESLDLNSSSPLSATRGRRSQAPEPSDSDFLRHSSPESTTSPALPLLPKSVEAYRLMSREGYPRSPLYISQAAMSSSPEKSKAIAVDHNRHSGDFSVPTESARVLNGHRPEQQQLLDSFSRINDLSSFHRRTQSTSSRNEDFGFEAPQYPESGNDEQTENASVVHHSSFTMWELPEFHRPDRIFETSHVSIQNMSSGQPVRSSSPASDEGAFPSSPPDFGDDAPLSPISTPRYLAYPARRLRGGAEGLHSSSPRVVPPPRNVPSTIQPYRASPTPPPPGTPFRSIQVYNDQLSPTAQPQTPRNRHIGPFDPAFTAPAVPAGSIDSRWLWQGGRRRRPPHLAGSPVEAEDWDDEDQENASIEGERNRLVRRLMNRSGVMRRVNSWVRRENAEDFDRTPPAETFRWY